MGTNYYAIPKACEEQKEVMKEAIDKDDWNLLHAITPTKIHIGKSSYGWAFCFNHNNWEHFNDLESLKSFLDRSVISDEYGRNVTSTEFWEMVESKKNDKKHLEFRGKMVGTMKFKLNFSNSTDFC